MEIGSIYEIEPGRAAECNAGDGQRLAAAGLGGIKKYNKKYCVYTASGREAIAAALRNISSARPGLPKRCLLPAYMCDTVFAPFEREGWELNFYHLNKELAVDEDRLLEQIERLCPGLLFIHPYYGVDTCRPLRPLLSGLKKQGLCVMEDVTQSYYLDGAGVGADYVVGSLRKWYPIPDGGFAAFDEEPAKECRESDAEYIKARLGALIKKWEYLHDERDAAEKAADKEAFLKQNRELEEQLDKYSGIRHISDESAHILQNIDEDASGKKRNENYLYLYDRLKDENGLCPIISICGKDKEAAPLYFAVYAQNRDALQGFLSAHGVYAPILWPIGSENENHLTPDEKYIYEHMLAIPIDQRYGIKEMKYIVEVVKAYGNPEN